MNILDAMRDAKVFGPFFRGDTWGAWRAFLAALFALPMSDADLAIYRECTGRNAPPNEPSREAWLIVGRRGGKSYVLALIAVFVACFVDWRACLSPGEVGTVMVIAADRRQARVIMRFVLGLLQAVPMLKRQVEGKTAESITLKNRIVIEVHVASYRTVRGYTVITALLDEMAFWPTDEAAASPDVEVLNALRPAMATVPGAMLLCASSPHARKGALWDARQRHYGRDGDPILVWQAATRTMNASVPQSFIDEAMAEDPARGAAEYGAEFRTDVQSFVPREAVEACVAVGVGERAPVAGTNYVAFVDPSGGTSDSMSLAIAHRDADGRAILDLIREKRPPFSPADVVREFAEVLKRYGVSRVAGDKFGGEFAAEPFKKAGIGYEQWDRPKSDLYANLLPMLNSRGAELLDDGRLVAQLCSLERRTSRAGKDQVGPGPRAHDDVCNCVAGALMLAQRGAPALWRREDLPIVPGMVSCEVVFGVLVAGEREVGAVYFARDRDKTLHVVDASSGPMTRELLDGVPDRLLAFAKSLRGIGCCLFTQAALVGEFRRRGHVAHAVDAILAEGHPALALSAAAHIAHGRLVIGDARHAGILTGWGDDPTRLAMLVAVAVGLDVGRTLGRAA